MEYSFTAETPIEELVPEAIRLKSVRKQVVDALSCDSRALRQYASTVLLAVSETDPALLVEHSEDIIDGIHRPEPMTRYHVLQTIDNVINADARVIDKHLELVESCLYDEDSAKVRGSAFNVLAHYGSTTIKRSETIWPSLAEGLRCLHGDLEFGNMLSSLILLLEGKCSDIVREEAAELFKFDVNSTDVSLRKKARYIRTLAGFDVKAELAAAAAEKESNR